MKYKILITTAMYNVGSGGCAVHSLVVEFDTREAAETAAEAVRKTSVLTSQSVICLF